ncbi:hypothetical protein MED193_20899 [Roseobacter sp. MED193]|nr:hypothetical protein MED193_20899 [Roseobacter sp. MED193]
MSHLSRPDLWERISRYDFPTVDGGLTFVDLLRRDTKFTRSLAEDAIDEYRRFAYLTQVADQPLVPSSRVDKVWHLHLTLTRDYWERFCGETLGRRLHHTPGQGAFYEHPDYAVTLALYRKEFGFSPPYDHWPTSARKAPDTIFLAFALLVGLIGLIAKEPMAIYSAAALGSVFVLTFWVELPFIRVFGVGAEHEIDGSSCSSCGGD